MPHVGPGDGWFVHLSVKATLSARLRGEVEHGHEHRHGQSLALRLQSCLHGHNIKLPLRHQLDGKTSNKDGFTCPIGMLLSKVIAMEVNPSFKAPPGGLGLMPLPEKIVQRLSTDACVSYKYDQALRTCKVHPEPGPIVHSRWLTTPRAP